MSARPFDSLPLAQGRRIPLMVLLVGLLLVTAPPVIGTAPLAPFTQAQPSSELDGFDAFVASAMRDWKVPGVAVGVIRDGKVVLAKGYGFRDVGKQLPVTSQTLMAIGSNSKSFTVMLLGMLAEEQKLDLDKPVRNYLPDFQLQDDVATRLMTPVDLISHRSGLPRHDAMWGAGGFNRKELYQRLRFLEPSASFRQRYQYNNLMFMTAGILVEQVAGQSWDTLIKDRVFTPVGMTQSNTTVRDMPKAPDYSLPYVERGDRAVPVPFRNIDAVAPAGAINSNIDDMLRYVQMHIDRGSVGGKALISRAFSARMQAVHSAPDFSFDADDPGYTEFGPGGYGLGLGIRSYRGHKQVAHSGGIDGFISAMTWLPDDRLGIVVLSNLSGTNPVPNLVTQNLCDRLLHLPAVDVIARAKAAQARTEKRGTEREQKIDAERITGTSPSHPLADYAGTYEHPAYGPVRIGHDAGQLTMMYGLQIRRFEHFHYDVFRAVKTPEMRDWDPRMRISFSTNAAGRIDSVGVPFEPALAELIFKRKPASTSTASAGQ
jgi:CubicO group peptidase (beta-lactamase class C family)